MRKRARKDDNHNEIANTFITCGFSVHDTSQLGGGFPDIVVSNDRATFLVEIKDGKKPRSKQKLTTDEELFHTLWRGKLFVINSTEQALDIINNRRYL